MGPRINALGEIDFRRAQIIPARRTSPFSFQICRNEIRSQTLINDNIAPESGIFRLWRKLPKIISMEAHVLPTTETLSQTGLSGL
jgi:hypothetical protein